MRAAYVTELGPPEHIQVGEPPMPVVGAFDVLVRVRIGTRRGRIVVLL